MFLSQRLNGRGGFIVNESSGGSYYFDPNAVGSTLGVDEDGDCIYEREDALLDELERLEYDEIIIVGVSGLLKDGSKVATSRNEDPNIANSPTAYDNIMQEQERMDYHLARFIYKAKTEYNLEVLANLSYNIDPNVFYDYLSTFHDSAVSRSGRYDFVREHFENYMLEFLDNHIQTWQNDPTQMDTLGMMSFRLFFLWMKKAGFRT